jgi:hypothetical protein
MREDGPDTHCSNHFVIFVEDRSTDAANARFNLLVIDGVAAVTYSFEIFRQQLPRTQRLACVPREAYVAENVIDRSFGLKGQYRFPHCRAISAPSSRHRLPALRP